MRTVNGLYYTEDHEWVRVEDGLAYIGITDYAQEKLGEIVYVELPEEGDEFSVGDSFSVVESVKAASDCYMPVSGRVVRINESLEDSPQLINEDPYENWIIAVEMEDESELEDLMDEQAYLEFCSREE